MHPIFNIAVPQSCPGVPPELLDPRKTWSDPAKYDEAAAALAKRFRDNFAQFSSGVSDEIAKAGPNA